jgi:hypothetical protein
MKNGQRYQISWNIWIVVNRKNYIVYGPGRTGSHWVESILSDLYGYGATGWTPLNNHDVKLLPSNWIYHTNTFDSLQNIFQEVRDSATLIYCNRKNYFDAVVSLYTARATDEWNKYTDKIIQPFTIDIDEFNDLLISYHQRHHDFNHMVHKEVHIGSNSVGNRCFGPRYSKIITIEYEDLVNASVPEKFVAECLQIPYTETRKWAQQDNPKSARNYKDLILNWNELVAAQHVCSIIGHRSVDY